MTTKDEAFLWGSTYMPWRDSIPEQAENTLTPDMEPAEVWAIIHRLYPSQGWLRRFLYEFLSSQIDTN